MKTLFCNADILLIDGAITVLKNGYLGIDGNKIDFIGQEKPREKYDVEKQMANHMLIPGLYNMHTHTPMTLLRGTGSGLPLDRWLNEAIFPVEARLKDEDYVAGTQIALLEMIACGTVSFTDMYDKPWVTANEVINAGLKANLCRPIVGFDKTAAYKDSVRAKESVEFFKDYNNSANGHIKVEFAIHGEYTNYDLLAKSYGEECLSYGAQMHIHLSETKKEHFECKERHGKTPAGWFYDLGVFKNKTTAAHCVWIEPEDMDILLDNGVTCVHNPSSNMKLGSGFMPIKAMLDKGINLAIGTDGAASNNNLNMLEEMHLASVIHNGYTLDPTVINPNHILKMATINGAKGQGRENCGSLKVGNCADIVAIDMDKPHLMPVLDQIALLTYSIQASDVDMTMVDGKILYEHGEYLTVDFEKAKFNLKKTIARLF